MMKAAPLSHEPSARMGTKQKKYFDMAWRPDPIWGADEGGRLIKSSRSPLGIQRYTKLNEIQQLGPIDKLTRLSEFVSTRAHLDFDLKKFNTAQFKAVLEGLKSNIKLQDISIDCTYCGTDPVKKNMLQEFLSLALEEGRWVSLQIDLNLRPTNVAGLEDNAYIGLLDANTFHLVCDAVGAGKIRSLDLTMNKFMQAEHWTELACAIEQETTSIKRLILTDAIEVLGTIKLPNLIYFSLDEAKLEDDSASDCAMFLRNHPSLRHFNLHLNNFKVNGAFKIIEQAAEHPSLQCLQLHANNSHRFFDDSDDEEELVLTEAETEQQHQEAVKTQTGCEKMNQTGFVAHHNSETEASLYCEWTKELS
jgi:hypothetical protein